MSKTISVCEVERNARYVRIKDLPADATHRALAYTHAHILPSSEATFSENKRLWKIRLTVDLVFQQLPSLAYKAQLVGPECR